MLSYRAVLPCCGVVLYLQVYWDNGAQIISPHDKNISVRCSGFVFWSDYCLRKGNFRTRLARTGVSLLFNLICLHYYYLAWAGCGELRVITANDSMFVTKTSHIGCLHVLQDHILVNLEPWANAWDTKFVTDHASRYSEVRRRKPSGLTVGC